MISFLSLFISQWKTLFMSLSMSPFSLIHLTHFIIACFLFFFFLVFVFLLLVFFCHSFSVLISFRFFVFSGASVFIAISHSFFFFCVVYVLLCTNFTISFRVNHTNTFARTTLFTHNLHHNAGNGLPYWKLDNKRNGCCGDSISMHTYESSVVLRWVILCECVFLLLTVGHTVAVCVCCFCFAFTFCLFICVDYKRLAPQ